MAYVQGESLKAIAASLADGLSTPRYQGFLVAFFNNEMELTMKHLITFLLATIILPSAALASAFSGPYAGIQGGYEVFDVDADFTGAGAFAGDSLGLDLGASGVTGGVFAGYGHRMGGLYLGAELEGSLGGAESDLSVTSGGSSATLTLEHKHTYGASLRAGVFPIDNMLLYGRIGAVRSKFDSNAGEGDSLSGLRLGVGTEAAVTPNLTARADWTYTNYESFSATDASGTLEFSPDASTFRVGLAYNF